MPCYLIGHPLGHSFSPRLHALLGNPDYALMDLEAEEVEPFLRKGDFAGLNVTIPYKQMVMPFLDEITPRAGLAGAVNTVLRRPDGSLIGDNTDIPGFLALADRAGIGLAEKHAVILGSGGTMHTARTALRERGAASVTVVSRSGERNYGNLQALTDTQVLINATPVGMYPKDEGMPCDPAVFPRLEGVIDVVYRPLRTRLIQRAQALGLKTAPGLYMLVSQGRYAAEQFLGRPIPQDTAEKAYRTLLSEKLSIVLCGMPGSGKSAVGKAVAALSGRPFLDTDQMLEARAGMPCGEYITQKGEAAFRDAESDCVREAMRTPGAVVATGGGAVLREENRSVLRGNGMVFLLRRDLDALPMDGRPLSRSREALKAMAQSRESAYRAAADMEIWNNSTPEAAAQSIWEAFACAY